MLEWMISIVALIMNPVSLLIFLTVMKHMKKERKKETNVWWVSHQGRGA
jgi:hypothetical protein